MKQANTCRDCLNKRICQETTASWFFLFVGIVATISVRVVNIVLDFSELWAKIFWYIGITGFLIFFLYKFQKDNDIQKKLKKSNLVARINAKEKLNDHDYEFLGKTFCKLRSKKDKINYFIIFLSSALALLIAVYQDFLK